MITGLSPKTFENLQLNAGAFLKNFKWDSYEGVDALEAAVLEALETRNGVIGATINDGTFEAAPTTRTIEANGMRFPIVGSTVNDMWTIKLKGTMKEVTPENFKDALMCAEMETNEGGTRTVLKLRNEIRPEDYIDSFCWIGDTSKGLVLIELKNVLNVTGANFTFTDKGEGSIPFEFQAHSKDLKDSEYAPCTIVFFDKAE